MSNTVIYRVVPSSGLSPPSASKRLWLDAGLGVTVSASQVTNWADQSGNSRDAIIGSGGPFVTAAWKNSNPALDFRSSEELGLDPDSFITSAAWTMYLVFQADDSATSQRLIGDEQVVLISGGNLDYRERSPGLELELRTAADTSAHYLTVTTDPSSGNGEMFLDGVSVDSSATIEVTTGNSSFIGSRGGLSYYNGHIAEIIIYDGVHGVADLAAAHAYLAGKYAI